MSSREKGMRLVEEAFEAFHRDDREVSAAAADAALALARESADAGLEAHALIAHARLALRRLDFTALRSLCEQALDAAQRSGDPAAARMPLHMRAEAARLEGDLVTARELYGRSIALNRSLDNHGFVGVELHNLAYVDKAEGALDAAEDGFRAALDLALGATPEMVVPCLLGLGAVAADRGDGRRAGRLIAAAEAAMAAAGEVPDPADEPELRQAREAARSLLGEDADRVWAEGSALSLDEAVAEVVTTRA